jgi:hypothetical protein
VKTRVTEEGFGAGRLSKDLGEDNDMGCRSQIYFIILIVKECFSSDEQLKSSGRNMIFLFESKSAILNNRLIKDSSPFTFDFFGPSTKIP